MNNLLTEDFKSIVLGKKPLIDVRAPIEYDKGSFINAINLPIMTDAERHQVGIKYMEEGNEEAILLGHQLVTGPVKAQRVQLWVDFLQNNPEVVLFCFRGGQRSAISQQWIAEAGYEIPRLKGGYKAFRNYLLQALTMENTTVQPLILSGYTGSGKTILLKKLPHSIDLEGIANHRGSSFGRSIDSQPTQIAFDNRLAYAVIEQLEARYKTMILEDEGKNVGKCFIPLTFQHFMSQGAYVLLECSLETRAQNIYEEYVVIAQNNISVSYPQEVTIDRWEKELLSSLDRIKKRLGGLTYQHIGSTIQKACSNQRIQGNPSFDSHQEWIVQLLTEYYDPLYQHAMKKNNPKTIFQGNDQDVLDYLKSNQ